MFPLLWEVFWWGVKTPEASISISAVSQYHNYRKYQYSIITPLKVIGSSQGHHPLQGSYFCPLVQCSSGESSQTCITIGSEHHPVKLELDIQFVQPQNLSRPWLWPLSTRLKCTLDRLKE